MIWNLKSKVWLKKIENIFESNLIDEKTIR
jgi:hypothetical protein